MADAITCKAADCDKAVKAKGYCEKHFALWRKGKMGKPRHPSCNEAGCGKAPSRRGLCPEHFTKHYSKAAPAADGAAAS
jgi:hypothetical protein